MAVSIDSLIAWRDSLIQARLAGVRRFRDANGEEVEYRSDTELSQAIASADSLIAQIQRGTVPTTFRFQTSKGL